MKKLAGAFIYILCFFVLFTVIYRLAFLDPVLPGEDGYRAFCAAAAGLAAVISGLAIGAAAGLEIMCRKYHELKEALKKQKKNGNNK